MSKKARKQVKPTLLPQLPTQYQRELENLRQMYESGILTSEYANRIHDLLNRPQ